jgi:hypothetical protein
MATTTNYSWSTPDDTALVKDGAAAIRSLGTAIDSTVFTNAGAAINKSIVDAAGDLIIGTADNTVGKLAIGTASQQLRVNSGATSLEYFTPVSAGGMTLISEQVASANTAIDFNSISGSYKQLILVWSGIVHSNNSSSFDIRFNNSSSSVYHAQWMSISNTSASTGFYVDDTAAEYSFGRRADDANIYRNASGYLIIDNYASSTKVKPYLIRYSFYNTDATTRNAFDENGIFNSTTAITSVNIYRREGAGTFSNTANTSIRLYGLS